MKAKRNFTQYSRAKSGKRTLSENMRRMHHFLLAFCFSIGIAAGALSLWSNAHQATQAYTLRELHAEQELLKSESRTLDHFLLQSQSLENLELSSENQTIPSEESALYLNDSDYAQVIPQ